MQRLCIALGVILCCSAINAFVIAIDKIVNYIELGVCALCMLDQTSTAIAKQFGKWPLSTYVSGAYYGKLVNASWSSMTPLSIRPVVLECQLGTLPLDKG